MTRRNFAAALAALLAVGGGFALSGAQADDQVANQIVIDNFAFGPQSLTVKAGTTVVWINRDEEPHTVVYSGEARLFRSKPLDTNDKFSFRFSQPGTYKYYCSVHPHMTGVVIVQ
jgi:plastocyanin